MGDRANIGIRQENDSLIYLYTHWGGDDLPLVLQQALAREKRWQPAERGYLTRIIFSHMLAGRFQFKLEGGISHMERVFSTLAAEGGFGIGSEMFDNEHPVLVVERNDFVTLWSKGDENAEEPALLAQWTFAEYIALPLAWVHSENDKDRTKPDLWQFLEVKR